LYCCQRLKIIRDLFLNVLSKNNAFAAVEKELQSYSIFSYFFYNFARCCTLAAKLVQKFIFTPYDNAK
jgi:hypothetical protein